MAQTGYTPISIYYSATATNTPTAGNLVAGELAINTADGKLFYKDSSGVVQTIATKASAALGGSTTGSGAVVLATSPTVTTPTIDKINTSVANTSLGAGNASIMKNRIINGAMVIDQRNAGASVTSASSYTLDRWKDTVSATGKFTIQQNAGSVTPPVGFTNYLGITSSAATTVAAGDYYVLDQSIEGYNVADLGWGSASAKTITISFQVYSSLTGTFGCSIRNSAANRSYPFTYSIPVANTWTAISVTVAGDTTGTWVTNNGTGLRLFFGLGVGSTFSGTAGSWSANNYLGATGATSVVGTSGATFYITGVQLEVGSSATGFEYVNYQTSLANCQRYYEQWTYGSGYGTIVVGQCESLTLARGYLTYTVQKRAAPTIATSGTQTNINATGTNLASTYTFIQTTPSTSYMYGIVSSGLIAGNATQFVMNSANANISFSAEL